MAVLRKPKKTNKQTNKQTYKQTKEPVKSEVEMWPCIGQDHTLMANRLFRIKVFGRLPYLQRVDCVCYLESVVFYVQHMAYKKIRCIGKYVRRIRKYLPFEAAKSSVKYFVISRIDNCNAKLYGLPAIHVNRLQRVRNAAARLLTTVGDAGFKRIRFTVA